MLSRFPITIYVGVTIVIWGGVNMCLAAVHNFAGLAAVRFFLGFSEGKTHFIYPSASKSNYPTRNRLASFHYYHEYLVQAQGTSDSRCYMGINERYSQYYRCPHDVWYRKGKHVTCPVAFPLPDMWRFNLRDWPLIHILDAPRYDNGLVPESTGTRSGNSAHGDRSRYPRPCSVQQSSTQGGTLVADDLDLLPDGNMYHPDDPHNEGMPALLFWNTSVRY